MRADIFVPTISVEEQIQFYVYELALFTIAHDYGMGNILLRHIDCAPFCLQLMPGMTSSGDMPIFCISTENCYAEFSRLSKIAFHKGGLAPGIVGSTHPFEYPLGKTFSLRDASENLFAIMEWQSSAM